jgi:hypothetical protein
MRRYNYNKDNHSTNPLQGLLKKKEVVATKPKPMTKESTPPAPQPKKDLPVLAGMKPIVKNDLDAMEVISKIKKEIKVVEKKHSYDEQKYKNWWENNDNSDIRLEYCLEYICSLDLPDFQQLEWIQRIPRSESYSYESQLETLHVLVKYLFKLGFPKVNDEPLLLTIFKTFLTKGIIEDQVFVDWYELQESGPERRKAMIQTSEWILQLMEKMDEEAEDTEIMQF